MQSKPISRGGGGEYSVGSLLLKLAQAQSNNPQTMATNVVGWRLEDDCDDDGNCSNVLETKTATFFLSKKDTFIRGAHLLCH